MLTFECLGCGDDVVTDNEDAAVFGLCDFCSDYGSDGYTERGYTEQDFSCDCEDYPCCGH